MNHEEGAPHARASFLSPRLAARLTADGWPQDAIRRLASADFSDGEVENELGWARHNERVHIAIVLCTPSVGFDAALALARRDWRDALVAGGLANEGWKERIDRWLTEGGR